MIGWAKGYVKVGHKARHGRRRHVASDHYGHHKKLPAKADRESAKRRRALILYLRFRDLDDW